MPEDRRDFYNLVDLTREFRHRFTKTADFEDVRCWSVAAQLAQAQQLSVISRHLADIAAQLELITGRKKGEAS